MLHSVSLEGINEVNNASALCIIDEAIKRYTKPHHVHIGSLFAYFFNQTIFSMEHTTKRIKVFSMSGHLVNRFVEKMHWVHKKTFMSISRKMNSMQVLKSLHVVVEDARASFFSNKIDSHTFVYE